MSDTTLEEAEHTNISSNISVLTVLILFELQKLDAIWRLKSVDFMIEFNEINRGISQALSDLSVWQ
jgi:hypothetical protein